MLRKSWRIGSEGLCHLPWLPRNALAHPLEGGKTDESSSFFALASLPGFDNVRTSEAKRGRELDATTFLLFGVLLKLHLGWGRHHRRRHGRGGGGGGVFVSRVMM